MPMLEELAAPHALPGAQLPPPQRAPPYGAWDFARLGVPSAALQQLLGPAAGLLAQHAQQVPIPGPLSDLDVCRVWLTVLTVGEHTRLLPVPKLACLQRPWLSSCHNFIFLPVFLKACGRDITAVLVW